MLSGLKLLALALFLYDLYQLRKKEKEEESEASDAAALEETNLKMTSNSIISLDKCKPTTDLPMTINIHSRTENRDRSRSSTPELEPMLSA